MKTTDVYSRLLNSPDPRGTHPVFEGWGYGEYEIKRWMQRESTPQMRSVAQTYIREVGQIVQKVEDALGVSLPGELVLVPSMGQLDGFARYERGHHTVMLGIDYPDASHDYLRALTAHELSHVYRDHQPEIWGFLGKPLSQVSREEYLEASTGHEHLVSEGLATLFSQYVFTDVAIHDHHYYFPEEMKWCADHDAKIDAALRNCLNAAEPDPWQFYSPGSVAQGSPSRTHYYWAAKELAQAIRMTPGLDIIRAHGVQAKELLQRTLNGSIIGS